MRLNKNRPTASESSYGRSLFNEYFGNGMNYRLENTCPTEPLHKFTEQGTVIDGNG